MIKPTQNRVFVRIAESINTPIPGFVIPPKTDKWTGRDGVILSENRGTVAFIGPDVDPDQLKVGDIIRFSEIQYPTVEVEGEKFIVISDMDVVGVEEEGEHQEAA